MNITDGYWANYEHPGTVDRKTKPPLLNFDLVRKINGRLGSPPKPFDWKGEIVEVENELKHPEELETTMNFLAPEIHCSSGALAQIYHKYIECHEERNYFCKVQVWGKCIQIFNCETQKKKGPSVQLTPFHLDKAKKGFEISTRCGIAIDTLFTTEGEINETTNAEIDKLAYFCVFERTMSFPGKVSNEVIEYTLKIRKEIDIMLHENDQYFPIELKTRTLYGMNKKDFCMHFLPALLTRCYLTGMFTVMIAVREKNQNNKIIKVVIFEDIRDIVPSECHNRDRYFRYFFEILIANHSDLTSISYGPQFLRLMGQDKPIAGCENLDTYRRPPSIIYPLEEMSSCKPDIVICDEEMFAELAETPADLVIRKRWAMQEETWSFSRRTQVIIILASKLSSVMNLLMKCEPYDESHASSKYNIIVYLPAEDAPSQEEVISSCKLSLGCGTWMSYCKEFLEFNVKLFTDINDLFKKLKDIHKIYQHCSHTMVLLGEKCNLPFHFSVNDVDVFKIATFPRMELLETTVFPEKIAVFGKIKECLRIKRKLSTMEIYKGYEKYTYFFVTEKICRKKKQFKDHFVRRVSSEEEILKSLIEFGLPYVL